MKITLFLFSFFIMINSVLGQCSDAGVCQLNIVNIDKDPVEKYKLGFAFRLGFGDKEEKITYNTIEVSGTSALTKNIFLNIKLPFYNKADGPLGSADGLGDILLSAGFIFNSNFNLSAGMRLATGDANAKNLLPMSYQTGLGTNDILLGLTYQTGPFITSIGYQWVEDIFNNNKLLPLKRGDDLMLNVKYLHVVFEIPFSAEIIAIQRLQKSEFLNSESQPVTIQDSDQLQVNIGLSAIFALSDETNLAIYTAFPLLMRDVNVDGLTRRFTLSAGVERSF